MNISREQLFLKLALMLILLWPLEALSTEIIDRIAAIVNQDVITLQDVNEEGEEVFTRIRREAPPPQQEAAIRRARQEVLDSLIERKLIAQRAAALNLSVSEEEIEAALQRMLTQNHFSRDRLLQELRASGTTEARYRDRLRSQILQSKLIGLEVRSRVVITDRKIKDYYERQAAGKQQAEGYHLLQMGFTWNQQGESPTREETRGRAEKIRELAAAGGNFQELAEAHSDLPSARDGGEIGSFKEEEMAPYMREVLIGLQPGEISNVVETGAGFQFFKLISIRKGDSIRQAPFDQIKNELKEKVYQEEVNKQFEIWLQELRADAYIRKLL